MTAKPDYSKPFAHVLGVGIGHFHPDVYDERDIDDLREEANAEPLSPWMQEIKDQLTQALAQNLEGMDVDEFDREVEPSAKSTLIFIRRMWAIMFPDDPIPGSPAGPFDALYTIHDIYFRDRDPDGNQVHPRHLIRMLRLPDEDQTPLLRAIKPELTRMLQGDFEGLDMREFRSETSTYYFHQREDDKDFARHLWRYLFPDQPLPEA